MADETFVFGRRETQRIATAVRRVERMPGQRPGPPIPNVGQNHQFVRVTGAATTQGGKDYYPCRLQVKNPTTGAWADATPTAELWLENLAGVDLVTDGTGNYPAKQLRDQFTVSGTTRPLFVTVVGDCDTSVGSFPTMDETQIQAGTKFLVNDPTLGTRTIEAKKLRHAMHKAEGVETVTFGSPTTTFNLANSLRKQVTLTGNTTYALSNEFAGVQFALRSIQDGTGGRAVTWFSGIIPPFGVMPPVSPVANMVTQHTFERVGAGSYRLGGVQYWMS